MCENRWQAYGIETGASVALTSVVANGSRGSKSERRRADGTEMTTTSEPAVSGRQEARISSGAKEKKVAREAREAAMEPRKISQKRMTEAMAEMSLPMMPWIMRGRRQGQSGTCDKHGGASAVPQTPSASDVDSAGTARPLDEKTSGNGCDATGSCGHRSSDNSADGVGSG